MAFVTSFGSLVLASIASLANAQSLENGAVPAYIAYPGLSTTCQSALNTTTNCPAFLKPVSITKQILDTDQVSALCTGSCLSDLQSARSTIQGACTASTDVIVYNDVAYPATFVVDQYIFTHQVSCYQDSSTGQYCDPQFLAWSNQTTYDNVNNQTCSPCWLGVQALQLGDPLGYDEGMASDFSNLTEACNATGYAYASPTAYGLNATTTPSGSSTFSSPPTCTGSYIPTVNDTCNSIAQEMSVSTYSLIYANGLDLYCQNFEAVINSNTSLCTPPTCQTYTWTMFDTCNNVAIQYGISIAHFIAWNPNFNSICSNTVPFNGYQVCVSAPGGSIDSRPNMNGSESNIATTAAPIPTNSFPQTRECGQWYNVSSGDDCASVALAFAITLSDFLFLNPEVYTNCTNLLLGVAYCVVPVGNIQSYSGYSAPPTMAITVPPATFSSVNTAIPSITYNGDPSFTISQMPTASGTLSDCVAYVNYNDNTTYSTLNGCTYITYAYDVSFADLINWNPSLSRNESSCTLQPGLSYCVQQTNATASTSTLDNCISVNNTEIVAGTDPSCVCYTEVLGYDTGLLGCSDVAYDSLISVSQLQTWNSWLQSDCDNALFANMQQYDRRAVCIGVNSTAPTSTATQPPTTTTANPTETSSSATTGPTQTGIISTCTKFYTVQSGDSCASIEGAFAITFAEFYSWNPSIGSNCQSLWLGYAYCVSAPVSTSTGGGNGPAAPTQAGEADNCNQYYTVQSGDSCSKIESQYSITFAQLYQWNPAIGSDCTSLWVGYAVCVGVSS